MKYILSLFCLFFSANALAADYELACMTDPASTSFGIWREGDEMRVRVIHHYGTRFAPAFAGIYTPNDLPYLAEQARLVLKMPAVTTFRWPRKNCGLKGEVFKCFGTEDVQEGEGGAKLKPFAIYTSASSEETIAGKHEYLTVSLHFDVDGQSGPRLEMKYPKDQCARGDSALARKINQLVPLNVEAIR